ncbi:hypothetical protein NM09_10255 [Vibrio caribbeanicus]|uniref:Uncharacterized protein n=1 Tax=Vibrio caribbeanicus TaxID=701175 RepID=A0ACC4NX78_9VIBR|nr:hypothetical protein NM09_10255 [Vibrio caribbeanicus]
MFKVQWFKLGGWRCSPLNAALGAVRSFLVQISNFSLAICSSFSAIWLYLLKFLNHLTRKTCQSLRVASLAFVANLLLVPLAQIASILFVFETRLLADTLL